MNAPTDELAALRPFADLDQLPRFADMPGVRGVIRAQPADFQVVERLPFKPAGRGEHWLLRVRKTGQNTQWVAKRLADLMDLPYRRVSYAGLKDRNAVTEQWFSLHLPRRVAPEVAQLKIDGVQFLESAWHDRKLRRGQLAGNQFRIFVRDLDGETDRLEARVRLIAKTGVPNYFGAQRFGRSGNNLELLFAAPHGGGREPRGFGLSALRSALFNGYLAGRVADGTWNDALPGEQTLSPPGAARGADSGERYPSGPLWGLGSARVTGEAELRERAFVSQYPRVCTALEDAGARLSRRSLVAPVGRLRFKLDPEGVVFEFALGPGCYATMLLRELLDYREHSSTGTDVAEVDDD